MKNVLLFDRDALKFRVVAEANGVELRNGPPYVRECESRLCDLRNRLRLTQSDLPHRTCVPVPGACTAHDHFDVYSDEPVRDEGMDQVRRAGSRQ
jgi:hypothetical protein